MESFQVMKDECILVLDIIPDLINIDERFNCLCINEGYRVVFLRRKKWRVYPIFSSYFNENVGGSLHW